MCLLTSFCILKLGGKDMRRKGRPKGGTNKYWSKEQKFKVIEPVITGKIGRVEATRQAGISFSQMHNWLKAHEEKGIEGLDNKRKPGNPLAKFQNKKNLTELEQLQYENMKLRIENERLKKGYTNEEAMSIRRKK